MLRIQCYIFRAVACVLLRTLKKYQALGESWKGLGGIEKSIYTKGKTTIPRGGKSCWWWWWWCKKRRSEYESSCTLRYTCVYHYSLLLFLFMPTLWWKFVKDFSPDMLYSQKSHFTYTNVYRYKCVHNKKMGIKQNAKGFLCWNIHQKPELTSLAMVHGRK